VKREGECAEGVDPNHGGLDTDCSKVLGEALVRWTGDRHLELIRRKMSHEMQDLPRAAAERRARQELQDANHARSFRTYTSLDQSHEAGAQNMVDVRAPTVDHPSRFAMSPIDRTLDGSVDL